MRARIIVGTALVAAIVAATAAMASGDGRPADGPPPGFEQAVKDAGLEGVAGVEGKFVNGKWEVKEATPDPDGGIRYGPPVEK